MKIKILIVDDEQEMNFRLIKRLREFYDVKVAISVEAAINLLKHEYPFTLIFLDAMMAPGIYDITETDEGIETGWILYIKELRKLTDTKIIVWTKNSDIFSKPWGQNVVEKVIKSNDEDQLLNLAQKYIWD